jgi:hypothetical protein
MSRMLVLNFDRNCVLFLAIGKKIMALYSDSFFCQKIIFSIYYKI